MVQEIQKAASKEFGASICVCIERKAFGPEDFTKRVEGVRRKICLRHICGELAIIDLNSVEDKQEEQILALAQTYQKLAGALCIADEKNTAEEKEKLFADISGLDIKKAKTYVYAAILAIGERFHMDNASLGDVFGQGYNYIVKLEHVDDERSMKLWLPIILHGF